MTLHLDEQETVSPMSCRWIQDLRLYHRHAGTGTGRLSLHIRRRIVSENPLGTAVSAIWKITCRARVITFAPILLCFSSKVSRSQQLTILDRFNVTSWKVDPGPFPGGALNVGMVGRAAGQECAAIRCCPGALPESNRPVRTKKLCNSPEYER